MSITHSKKKSAYNSNVKEQLAHGATPEKAHSVAKKVKKHATWDDRDEMRIERVAHEKFKYGRGD